MIAELLLSASLLVPTSVSLFEKHKEEYPKSNFNLSLCKLLERGPRSKPFPALPSDMGEEKCDLSHTTLAYNGWCEAGIRDKKGGVHFSQSLMPWITIVQYQDGHTVVYVNNYLKSDIITTEEDEKAAVEYFSIGHQIDELDVRGEFLPIFPQQYDGYLPLKKGKR